MRIRIAMGPIDGRRPLTIPDARSDERFMAASIEAMGGPVNPLPHIMAEPMPSPGSQAGPADAGGREDRERWLFLALLLLHIVPLWAFRYFPSTDGPSHLENAQIINVFGRPDRSVFTRYYRPTARDVGANRLGHLALAGLMRVVTPLTAEKILLTGYVILFPVSVRYALGSVRPTSRFLAVLAFPFTYSYLLHYGFYYFCYSLAAFFLFLGFWLRHRETASLRAAAVFTALGLLLFFTHLFSLVMAVLALGLLVPWLTALDLLAPARADHGRLAGAGRALMTRALVPLYALLPALLLLGLFLRGQPAESRPTTGAAPELARELGLMAPLVSFGPYASGEGWLARAVLALLLALAAGLLGARLRRRRGDRLDGLLLLSAGCLALYFTAPEAYAEGYYLRDRLALYAFLLLLPWLGAEAYSARARLAIQVTASSLALGFLLAHAERYRELNGVITEYTSAAAWVEPDCTLLPIGVSGESLPNGRRVSERTPVFVHTAGYIAASREVVDLANYQATTAHFPYQFRPVLKDEPWVGIGAVPPSREPDLLAFEARTGGRVDYVLLWADPRDMDRDREGLRAVRHELDEGYDLIFTSTPRAWMHVYRRRPPPLR